MKIIIIVTGGGVDYQSGPYNVKFPAGVTNVSFNVLINNDNILEVNEEFNLIIRHSSSIATHSPHRITVIILNDDSKYNCMLDSSLLDSFV